MWADNAASSPHFGTVYVCYTPFDQSAGPEKIAVTRSTDGGDTWSEPTTLSPAFDNPTAPGPPGLLGPHRQPGHRLRGLGGLGQEAGVFRMARSFDGGATFEKPRR